MKRRARTGILVSAVFLVLAGAAGYSQARQPPAYILSAGDKVIIILGERPADPVRLHRDAKGTGGQLPSPLSPTSRSGRWMIPSWRAR